MDEILQRGQIHGTVQTERTLHATVSKTVVLKESAGAVLYDKEQNLTEDQQAQARQNIGGAVTENELQTMLDEKIDNALGQAKDSGDFDGESVTIVSIEGSEENGGTNIVTFSDGNKLAVKNGEKGETGATGSAGYTPEKGVDYYTSAEKKEMANSVLQEVETDLLPTMLDEKIDDALEQAKDSGEFDGEQGEPGVSGVHVGEDTPPDSANVWVVPTAEPTSTEDWEFEMADGTYDTKTVVVLGADKDTADGQMGILRVRSSDGTWQEIPALKGAKGDAFTYEDFTAEQLAALKGQKGDPGTSAYDYAKAGGYTGTEAEFITKLNADIATTKTLALSNSAVAYVKISDFGAWGTGAWHQKGFSMLITSRAGELVWVAVSSSDSGTNAKAIRLLDTYSKIAAIYYSEAESAVYVKANAYCNNINAHILSNVYGDYVPTVTLASALPSDAAQITITEFGAGYNTTNIGDTSRAVAMTGSGERPTYNGDNLALQNDVPSRTLTLTFTLEDGSTVQYEVYVK